jgi:chromate transporter
MHKLFIELFITFFKIGLFTIGGGYAMIPLIQQEMIGHGWLTLQEIVDIIAISEMTPGPFAINTATFVGIRTGGIIGAVFSTVGVVLPSFIVSYCFLRLINGIFTFATFLYFNILISLFLIYQSKL